METFTKKQIAEQLANYVAKSGSQNKAANRLIDVSPATISHILAGKWDSISEEMWRSLDKQTDEDRGWVSVPTKPSRDITSLITSARVAYNAYAICMPAGNGKTHTAKGLSYQEGVFWISCSRQLTKRNFMAKLFKSMGREIPRGTINDQEEALVSAVLRIDKPVFIFDEADKMPEPVFLLFLDLYNAIENKCGLVFLATSFLHKRLERGVRNLREGYEEIYSRMGKRCIMLSGVDKEDVTAIVKANGITDKLTIDYIWNECEGDLRRVRKSVYREKAKLN